MKSLVSLSILLVLFFSSMIGYSIISNPVTTIESEIEVQVPAAVVFKALYDFESYSEWSTLIKGIKSTGNSNTHTVTYQFGTNKHSISQHYQFDFQSNEILANQLQKQSGAIIGNFQTRIAVKNLRDGTTSVSWQITYSALSIGAKLLNPVLIKSQIKNALEQNLLAFRSYIER